MPSDDRNSDKGDAVTTLSVFDLNMASAYYACVFDAEISDMALTDRREMKIGDRRYVLKLHKTGAPPHDPYIAEVEDADVCVARGATNGGTIVDAVSAAPGQPRSGALRDPFGLSWRVTKKR